MKPRSTFELVAICCFALAAPSLAATKPKKASGVYCEQGSQNVSIPISRFKPEERKSMRVGQKAKINIAGFGPVNCRVY